MLKYFYVGYVCKSRAFSVPLSGTKDRIRARIVACNFKSYGHANVRTGRREAVQRPGTTARQRGLGALRALYQSRILLHEPFWFSSLPRGRERPQVQNTEARDTSMVAGRRREIGSHRPNCFGLLVNWKLVLDLA